MLFITEYEADYIGRILNPKAVTECIMNSYDSWLLRIRTPVKIRNISKRIKRIV